MLHQYIEEAVRLNAESTYLKTNESSLSFKQVYEQVLFFKELLVKNEIKNGDRVLIYSSKNAASIALMMACSMCQAVYVPVSSLNPALRAKYIILETAPSFILCDESCGKELMDSGLTLTPVHTFDVVRLYRYVPPKNNFVINPGTAFILFTSGSTGNPKGVVISHKAATIFVNWAAKEFGITSRDVLASIAPFNFDLSVFDIYVAVRKSATLVLYSEDTTKNALLMAQKISLDKVTTVYATPTFYSTLALYGKLQKYDYSYLKKVLFAGEVFHLDIFKTLLEHWPNKNYANLYGPTETNVCTYFKVDLLQMDYPVFPIGKACEYASLLLMDEEGNEITVKNKRGELLVAGQSLFSAYWNDEVKTKSVTYIAKNKQLYYKTGDLVIKNDDGNYVYLGRNDRMIKKNGFRIEPFEIEQIMINYPGVSNVAVCFSKDKNQLCCFLESMENAENDVAELKKFCQKQLPTYMIPDKFVLLQSMPKTSSGKVDLQLLNNQL